MASSAGIIKKVNGILRKVGPPTRLVYLRTVTRTGADKLTGFAGTATPTDTLLSPQPYYVRIGRDRVPGPHTRPEDGVVAVGNVKVLDDWAFYISPDAVSLTQIQDPDFRLVCKSTTSATQTSEEPEVFQLIDMDPAMIYGAGVLFTCFMRSTSRGS